jgi:hypothetical protein
MTFRIAPQVLQFRPGQSIYVTARSTDAVGNNPFQLKLLNNVFDGLQTDGSGNKIVSITIPSMVVGTYTLSGISALDGTHNVSVKIAPEGTDTTLQPAAIFTTWRIPKYTLNEGGAPNPCFVTIKNVSNVTGRFRVYNFGNSQDNTLLPGQSVEIGFSSVKISSFTTVANFTLTSLDASTTIVPQSAITFRVTSGKSPPGELQYWTPGTTDGGGNGNGNGTSQFPWLLLLAAAALAFAGGRFSKKGRKSGK